MMSTRLTFASLLVAASAGAVEPPPAVEPLVAAVDAAPAAPLTTAVDVQMRGGELRVRVTATNVGDDVVSFILKRGRVPGTDLVAMVDGQGLEPIFTQLEQREFYSRMGPMPTWGVLAAGTSTVVGEYRFKLPKGSRLSDVTLEGTIFTQAGGEVRFSHTAPAPAS